MALFRSNDNGTMAKQPSAPTGQVNIIGQGTTIEGGLTASSDVRIAGRVVGEVKVQGKTVVTPEGEIDGQVHSSQADVAGHIKGDVVIEERLVLKSTARIEGSIYTKKLVIEDGATFTGTCDMSGALPRTDSKSKRTGDNRSAMKPVEASTPPAASA